ncbi:hypothetical protein [Ferrovibrio sp.]
MKTTKASEMVTKIVKMTRRAEVVALEVVALEVVALRNLLQ